MSAKEFNAAFNEQASKPLVNVPSAHEMAEAATRRDQTRVRLLAVVALIFWLLTVAGLVLLVIGLNEFMMGYRLHAAPVKTPPHVIQKPDPLPPEDLRGPEFDEEYKKLAANISALLDKISDSRAEMDKSRGKPEHQQLAEDQSALSNSLRSEQGRLNDLISRRREITWQASSTQLLHHSVPVIIASFASLFLAALFTVLLIFASRRATLNRINISLAQICEELKGMQRSVDQSANSGQS